MSRIGLLGGSFDPIHLGHIEMAKQALKQLYLDEVWFVVSNDTPLKERNLTSYQDREKMVATSIQAYRKFRVCNIEKTTKGKNYTIDTVLRLKKQNPLHTFFFIIGGDQVKQLDKWKDIEHLQEEVNLCFFERDGEKIKSNYKLTALKMQPVPISSSEIRLGKMDYVNKQIKQYISMNFLYEGIVSNYMSDYRYSHTKQVASVCKQLAKQHGANEHIAYLSGMYHDINKEFLYMSLEESKVVLKNLYPEILAMDEGIYHGAIGAYVAQHYLGIKDTRILKAIEHHVLGDHDGIYSKILFLADKLEPTRKYETKALLAVAFKDLDVAIKLVKDELKTIYDKEEK